MQDKPRAIVALSEDRQWLVVLKQSRWFALWDREYALLMVPQYEVFERVADDTGQDAHDVLAAWLDGRNG